MNWFKIGIEAEKEKKLLYADKEAWITAVDHKYGDYDYTQDLRSVAPREFAEIFKRLIAQLTEDDTKSKKKALVCGANRGVELEYLQDYSVTAFDLSKVALEHIRKDYPEVTIIHGDVNQLPFLDDSFDLYIAMRTLPSAYVNIEKAMEEAIRVTRKGGGLIVSVSNGYLVEGQVVKGMYDVKTGKFDKEYPYLLSNKIKRFLEMSQLKPVVDEVNSEIIISTKSTKL